MPGTAFFSVAQSFNPGNFSPLLWALSSGYNPGTGAWINLGSGGNGFQPDPSKRPVLGTLSTGAASPIFDGVNDGILFPPACSPTTAFTAAAVVQTTGPNGYNYWFGSDPNNAAILGAFVNAGGQPVAVVAGVPGIVGGPLETPGVPAVLSFRYDGATLELWHNLTLIGSSVGSALPIPAVTNLILGNSQAIVSALSGGMTSAIITPSSLSNHEHDGLVRYCASQGGFSV